MPALVAVRHDPHLKAFYQTLLARRKAKLQALIAVARKLLHAIYGSFRNQTPYDGRKLLPASRKSGSLIRATFGEPIPPNQRI